MENQDQPQEDILLVAAVVLLKMDVWLMEALEVVETQDQDQLQQQEQDKQELLILAAVAAVVEEVVEYQVIIQVELEVQV
jgi:hypothetical protein